MHTVTVYPPLRHGLLNVYFLQTPDAVSLPQEVVLYLTALKSGQVKVKEQRTPTIRRLHVHNLSEKLVFVLPGTVVFGGLQDRIVATAALLEPGEQTVDISSFCVEPARWHPERARTPDFYILENEFLHYASHLVRTRALHEADQLQVWNAVHHERAKACRAYKARLISSSIRDVHDIPELSERIGHSLQELREALTKFPTATGIALALGSHLVEINLFSNRQLLEICYPVVLGGYLRDTLIYGLPRTQEAPSSEQVQQLALTQPFSLTHEAKPARHNRVIIGPVNDQFDALILEYRGQTVYKQIMKHANF
ncbi:MAG: DUF6569 family protein [Gemmatales bacterium]|nr:hypothetical protein [Gemmatales bacterium]MDW8174778.1 DUF6569 family protein [Gemmatales bacterium]MDW8221658.1 DUF6569 family protein [Gemmatales bacterium]